MRLFLITASVGLALSLHAEISTEKDGGNLRVKIDGELFTEYRADQWLPCLHPLISAKGTHLTRRFPFEKGIEGEASDHPHHVGFWFTHGNVNGSDYWHGGKDGSKVVTKRYVGEPVVDKESVSFSVDLEWMGKDGKRDLSERRTYHIKSSGPTRSVEVRSKLTATDGDVVFGDTKEGSFAIRVAPTLRHKGEVANGHILNSEGLEDGAAWGKRAAWVAYHGPDSKGNPTVIALMDGADNLHHPTWWHARDYGLLAANPFGPKSFKDKAWKKQGDYVLKNGESLTQSYLLILHQGDLASADLEAHWESFSK